MNRYILVADNTSLNQFSVSYYFRFARCSETHVFLRVFNQCGRQKNAPSQRHPCPNTQSLHGKRDSAGVIKLRILTRGGYPELSQWNQSNYKGSYKRKREARVSEQTSGGNTHQSNAVATTEPQAKECMERQGTEFPWSVQKEGSPAHTSACVS